MQNKKGLLIAAVGAALLILLVVAMVSRAPVPQTQVFGQAAPSAPASQSMPEVSNALAVPAPVPAASAPQELPASLRGTQVPGGLRVDSDGHLMPDVALRNLFDYFLSALGEEPLDTLLGRIRAHLEQALPEPARSEALAALSGYVDYKAALADLENSLPALDTSRMASINTEAVAERLARVRDMRRTHLGAALADAFFADEEAYDRFTLERLQVERDPTLSPQERAARLASAEALLPEYVREARAETQRFEQYQQQVDALQAEGASPARIQALREQTFGPEAAARLAELDRERAAWDKRWQHYVRERDALAQRGLAGAELERAREALRERMFDAQERLRAEALDGLIR